MHMANIATILEAEIGKPYFSDWLTVDQAMIDSFADVTQDWNFIHVDAEKLPKRRMGERWPTDFYCSHCWPPCGGRVGGQRFRGYAWG